MSRLTAADRRNIPKSQFGNPSKAPGPGSYPMPDSVHAAAAKSFAARFAGPAVKAKVDAKANNVLNEPQSGVHSIPRKRLKKKMGGVMPPGK